jgi:hypothetical protein
MVWKVLPYRDLVVLSIYIPSLHNIAYQSKHNIKYNKKKMFQPSMVKSIGCYYKQPSTYVYIVRIN